VLTPLPDLGEWPILEWKQWKDTAETLHRFAQIVGKTRVALMPRQNHWWNSTLYVTARGLTTAAMPTDKGDLLDVELDFAAHAVVCRTSAGRIGQIALRPMSVAQFYVEFFDTLNWLGAPVHIDPMPAEIPDPVRCDLDTTHDSYDSDAVTRFWHTLRIADTLLKRFSTNFYGKVSPVHFFWGSFDLAATRFNGRRAATVFTDAVQREAYSHEVISAGFWPGNGGYGRAAFYAYAAPVPDGLDRCIIERPGAFNAKLGEFILDYEDARTSADPAGTVLEFLQETYSVAAERAGWDRSALDRSDAVAQAVPRKAAQHSGVPHAGVGRGGRDAIPRGAPE
jgi:hypothetical protein